MYRTVIPMLQPVLIIEHQLYVALQSTSLCTRYPDHWRNALESNLKLCTLLESMNRYTIVYVP